MFKSSTLFSAALGTLVLVGCNKDENTTQPNPGTNPNPTAPSATTRPVTPTPPTSEPASTPSSLTPPTTLPSATGPSAATVDDMKKAGSNVLGAAKELGTALTRPSTEPATPGTDTNK